MKPTAVPESATADDPRSGRRRQAILDVAATVFLRDGYVGASVDEIARAASCSKQTIYRYFSDKEGLFRELVGVTVSDAADPVEDDIAALQDSIDLESDLRGLARRQLAMVVRSEIMALRRLVIGEANRFPELARTFYELGPQRTIKALAVCFDHLSHRGLLIIDDPIVAAEHFNWLVMSTPLNRAMFLGEDAASRRALARHADEGVKVFLAAYGPRDA